MRVRRAPLGDWYAEDGEGIALVGEEVIVLSALGTFVVEHLSESTWAPLADVTDLLVAHFGAPEGVSASALTAEVLTQLTGLGVVLTDGEIHA